MATNDGRGGARRQRRDKGSSLVERPTSPPPTCPTAAATSTPPAPIPQTARDLRHRFGERAYAAEELVAELCSAFLCAEFSIDGDLRHAGYIKNWIGRLKADSRAFFTACSKAQAAANYLPGLALVEPTEIAA